MNNTHITIIAFSILLGLIIAMTIQVDKVTNDYNDLVEDYNECMEPFESVQNTPPLSEEYNLAEGLNWSIK